MQAGDGSRVAFVHVVLIEPSLGSRSVITIGLIHISFFRANPERSSFVVGEVQCRDGNFIGLAMVGMNK